MLFRSHSTPTMTPRPRDLYRRQGSRSSKNGLYKAISLRSIGKITLGGSSRNESSLPPGYHLQVVSRGGPSLQPLARTSLQSHGKDNEQDDYCKKPAATFSSEDDDGLLTGHRGERMTPNEVLEVVGVALSRIEMDQNHEADCHDHHHHDHHI